VSEGLEVRHLCDSGLLDQRLERAELRRLVMFLILLNRRYCVK
jgi:hypothetical protein